MKLNAKIFLQDLAIKVSGSISEDHKYFRSRRELRFDSERGHNSVILAAVSKWSPDISVYFHFACFFASAGKADSVRLGSPGYYHIHASSLNVRASHWQYDGATTWEVNLFDPHGGLEDQSAKAIREVEFPLFRRFPNERLALDAIKARDRQVFPLQSLSLSAALGELGQFEDANKNFLEGTDSKQLRDQISKLRSAGYS